MRCDRCTSGRISLLEGAASIAKPTMPAGMLSGVVTGPAAIVRLLSRMRHGGDAWPRRCCGASSPPEQSIITRAGEWIGRNWLRVSRGARSPRGRHRARASAEVAARRLLRSEENARDMEAQLAAVPPVAGRGRSASAIARRPASRARIASMRTCWGSSKAMRARCAGIDRCAANGWKRRPRKSRAKRVSAQEALARARAELDRGLRGLGELDSRRAGSRERARGAPRGGRRPHAPAAQAAQIASRDLLIRIESRRSSESSMAIGLQRMVEQRSADSERAARSSKQELASGDAPDRRTGSAPQRCARAPPRSGDRAGHRASRARGSGRASCATLDEKRLEAEQRVNDARAAMEEARIAAQETRVRRESICGAVRRHAFRAGRDPARGWPRTPTVTAWEADARRECARTSRSSAR